MIKDKPRASGMENKEHVAATILSITTTLIAWAATAGLVAMLGLGALSGCAGDQGEDNNATGESQSEHAGSENPESVSEDGEAEHAGAENPESGSEDGEESGESLDLDETYDFVRKGARLMLRYAAESNSFVGTVQNTTDGVLYRVRVEVHLSNGTELGPTTPVDLAPGENVEVSLAATEEPFTGWTPHAEVDTGDGGEHGGGGEGEHSEGRDGEHGGSEGEHGGSEGEHGGSGDGEHGEGGEGEHGGSEGSGEHGGGEGGGNDGEHGGGE